MKDFCPFLETKLSNDDKHCTAGINFSSGGAERALCRVCPLADLGDFPLCPNIEIYAFLRNSTVGSIVEVEFACLEDALLREARCQGCPNHSPSSSRKPEAGLRPSIQE
ncbi:MAG: hypothetical protein IBX69_09025 [Anaerolineales bacterium]|nr:hypothetical protein [Anaerolineales bacterium]